MHEPALTNPLKENWNKLLTSAPDYTFFHTSNWADVLNKSYHYRPFYLYADDDTSISLLPIMEVDSAFTGRRGVCLPFTDMCKPLAENARQFQKLFDQAVVTGRKQKWKYLEIRGGEEYLPVENPSQIFFGHTLDLRCGPKQLFSNLRDSTRRNIKKAQKENVRVTISKSPQAMNDFCRLNAVTRKEHGLPSQPHLFFQNLCDQVIAKNMGFIAIASINSRPVAANVYLNSEREVIYKYGASDKKFKHLRANNLLMWESIKWSCDQGFKRFCLGRTEPENEGLRQFKNGWGAREYIIKYYQYDFRENTFTARPSLVNPLYKKIFKTLPVPVLNILGKCLYRHAG
jgi:lipid II:glycine glycyltransferase (peptidoglycan interpeptide bridge formation enzyme)